MSAKIKLPCPHCGKQLAVPEHLDSVTCPACKQQFSIWEAPSTDAAQEPIPEPVPEPGQAQVEPPAFLQSRSASDVAGAPAHEPWFYWLLAGYTRVVMFIAVINVILAAIVAIVLTWWTALSLERPTSAVVGVVVLWTLAYLIGALILIVLILVWGAVILIFVDIGRSLRAIKKNTQ